MRGIYCHANFFCYARFPTVFGPNFRGKSLRRANCLRARPHAPIPPVEESQICFIIIRAYSHVLWPHFVKEIFKSLTSVPSLVLRTAKSTVISSRYMSGSYSGEHKNTDK